MAEIRINATGGLKLYDADDSHYAQIVAGTITSNTDVMTLGHAAVVMGTKLDMNGNNLILDADADTYLDGGTADDIVDVYVAGAKDWKFGANSINILSGTTLTIDSGATIANSGTATGFGVALDDVSAGAAASTLATSAGNITVDAQGDNTDIIFKGTDGGADTTALTIDMSEGGDLTLGANANIVFPGTNVVSTGANTFDDYEEGDWTPACPNVTVAGSEGKYTKVGRLVTVQGYATMPSTSDTNDVEISGLPFTINNSESGRGGAYVTYTTGGAEMQEGDGFFFLGAKNDTKFFASDTSGNLNHKNNEFSGDQWYINGQFYTDA